MGEKTGKPDECECCGFETKKIGYYEQHGMEDQWACDLCAATMTSTYNKSALV